MNLPLMLSPLEPSAPVDGTARAVGGGFAAHLLACLDTGVGTGTTVAGAPAPGSETPLSLLFASLTMLPAQTPEAAAGVDAAVPAGDAPVGSRETANTDPQSTTESEPAIATASVAGAVIAGAQPPPDAPVASQTATAVPAADAAPAVVAARRSPTAVADASPTAASVPVTGRASTVDQEPLATAAHGDASTPTVADAVERVIPATDARSSDDAAADAAAVAEHPASGAAAVARMPAPSGDTAHATGDIGTAPVAPPAASPERVPVASTRQPATPSADPDGTTPVAALGEERPADAVAAPARPHVTTSADAARRPGTADEGPTEQPATVLVDPASAGDADVAAHTTSSAPVAGSTGEAAAPATPTVARIVELVERLRAEPPPRTIVVDLEQFGIGKLVVSLRADTVVVEPLDANARLDPQWREELGAALDDHGWSFDAEGRSGREQGHAAASPRPDVPVTGRSSRPSTPADGHLRL